MATKFRLTVVKLTSSMTAVATRTLISPERNCSMHRDASPGVTLMLGVILLFLAATKPALIPKSLHNASLLRCLAKIYAAMRCFTNTIHRKEMPLSFLFSTKLRFKDSSFSDLSSL